MALSSFFETIGVLLAGAWLAGCIQPLKVGTDGGGGGGQAPTVPPCDPGEIRSCYDGPDGTEGVASCKAGTQTCSEDGLFWSLCVHQVLPDFEPCAAAAEDANCDGSTACAEATGWAMPFDPDTPDHTDLSASAVGPDHALYVAGLRHLGQPESDHEVPVTVILTKITPAGQIAWVKEYESRGAEITSLAVDQNGNLLVAGSVGAHIDFGGGALVNAAYDDGGTDVFFAGKLDPTGNEIWTHSYDSHTGWVGPRLVADPGGNMVLFGDFMGELKVGSTVLSQSGPIGPVDAFLFKLDANGEVVFARQQSALDGDSDPILVPGALRMDAWGAVYTSGLFEGDLDLGGPTTMFADMNSGVTPPNGTYLAKYDRQGSFVWQRGFVGSQIYGAAVAPTGGFVLTGWLQADTDFGGGALAAGDPASGGFLARYDETGNHLHSQAIAASDTGAVNVLSQRDDGIGTGLLSSYTGFDLSAIGGPVVSDKPLTEAVFRLGADDRIRKLWHWDFPKGPLMPLTILGRRDDGAGGLYLYGRYVGAEVDLGFGALPLASSRAFVAHLVP